MIERTLEAHIHKRLFQDKAIIILGPRQTGKTTLVRKISNEFTGKVYWMTGEDYITRQELSKHSVSHLKALVGNSELVVIDEAQYVENIGFTIKLMVDHIPEIQVIATGSSSLDLLNTVQEPLTGRKWEFRLYPFSYRELRDHHGFIEERGLLEHRLVHGAYPEVVTRSGEATTVLQLLAGSYLYKDLFMHEKLKKPKILERLIQALAYQLASEVSFHELAQTVGADVQTIEKYMDLLEKAFVIFRLPSLNRNLRNEIKKSRKVYFYDNGIRNAITGNFAPFQARGDKGALWENYFISERLKAISLRSGFINRYFWRTHAQQEIDYIEEENGRMHAYELKWNPKKQPRFPKTFQNAYPQSTFHVIHPDNYPDFL